MPTQLVQPVENAKEQAVALWRAGNYAEAREVLKRELGGTSDEGERIAITLNLSQVDWSAGKHPQALRVLLDIADDVARYFSPLIKGKYFNTLGAVRYALGEIDAAFEAYTAASIWYERAHDFKLKSEVENNIALLKREAGLYEDAHFHLDIAAASSQDEVIHAQIDDSRARVFLAEGKPDKALEVALAAVLALKDLKSEARLLFESLDTLKDVADALKKEKEPGEIAIALMTANGKVKQAAAILGMRHQTLAWKLEHHYPHLLDLRAPKKKPRGPHAVK